MIIDNTVTIQPFAITANMLGFTDLWFDVMFIIDLWSDVMFIIVRLGFNDLFEGYVFYNELIDVYYLFVLKFECDIMKST